MPGRKKKAKTTTTTKKWLMKWMFYFQTRSALNFKHKKKTKNTITPFSPHICWGSHFAALAANAASYDIKVSHNVAPRWNHLWAKPPPPRPILPDWLKTKQPLNICLDLPAGTPLMCQGVCGERIRPDPARQTARPAFCYDYCALQSRLSRSVI